MSPSTLETWAHGYVRRPDGRSTIKQGPVITAFHPDAGARSIPFVGLVEATVIQAFRRTGLPMQRIRKALDLLYAAGELEPALASRQLYSDGANILYDYARRGSDDQLRLLPVVSSGQRVFHEVIQEYLTCITFGDMWATELVVPVTDRALLRVRLAIADGEPLFVHGGAPLTAVRSRYLAGESVESLASDYGVPADDIAEAIDALWPQKIAA